MMEITYLSNLFGLGTFKVFQDVIRLKVAGDIRTQIHEFGHFIHEAVFGLTPKRSLGTIPAAYHAELSPLAYPGINSDSRL